MSGARPSTREWMQKGVPDLIRSAYFGHSPEVNRSYYTDTTNVSVLG